MYTGRKSTGDSVRPWSSYQCVKDWAKKAYEWLRKEWAVAHWSWRQHVVYLLLNGILLVVWNGHWNGVLSQKLANLINPSFPSVKLWCIWESFQEPHGKVIANTANLIALSALFSDWCPNSLRSWKSSESSRPDPLLSITGGAVHVESMSWHFPFQCHFRHWGQQHPSSGWSEWFLLWWSEWEMALREPAIWTLSPIGWLCGEVLRWHSLAGRRSSLGMGFESTRVHRSSSLLSAFCLHLRMWSLDFVLRLFPATPLLLLWTLPPEQ